MLELSSVISAARGLPAKEQAWWQAAYVGANDRRPLADSLARIERQAPKKLEEIFKLCGHGSDDDVLPWHLALLARSAGVSRPTVTALPTKPAFVLGSLHVKGPLQLKAPLVVTGDLTVDGPVVDLTEKWLLLVVGGSLKAHAIASSQDLLVGGDCTVRDLVWGAEVHCPFVVRGRVKTPLAVWSDRRPHTIGDAGGIGEVLATPAQEALERRFDPALLQAGEFKQKALVQRLVSGKPFGPAAPSKRR
ncbi:MAG: hypothetical protein JNJ54_29735 [Myxococcaceae bacterium]|nr:hypothetical protein [Myxococcaceae bacterium]